MVCMTQLHQHYIILNETKSVSKDLISLFYYMAAEPTKKGIKPKSTVHQNLHVKTKLNYLSILMYMALDKGVC